MEGMVDVIIPLSGVSPRTALPLTRSSDAVGVFCRALKIAGLIAIIFENEVHVAVGRHRTMDRLSYFSEYVWLRIVGDRVHGIEAQPVEVIFVQPVQRIVDGIVANRAAFRTVKVNSVSPRSLVAIGKELGGVGPKVIPFRAEVVINDIQQNHEPTLM